MGRKKRTINSRQNGKEPEASTTRKPYMDIVKENEKFVKYYQAQKVCKEEEWDEFILALKTDLPATFRITGSKGEVKRMLEIVQGQLVQDCLNQTDGDKSPSVTALPWYPEKLAWQLELTRKDIRRSEAYYKLHNFMITETENGTISRQETVSMIPPLLLDVQPHHKVLDMCAAPGSKTAQIIEMLHTDEEKLPEGYVIANDVDNKRCYMLVHQAKRLNSPCMAIINHDSTILPNLLEKVDGELRTVKYDRILCDVPCSGDGTLRKNPDIWMKWTPSSGLNQHYVQSRILRRGAELVTVGGRIVYSTCSINPLENEAVIHRLLCETNGAFELVDVSATLPGLKYVPGLEHWLVGTRDLEYYNSFDDVDEKWRTTIRPQMFPPKPEEKSRFNLHRCIRILPHHQNTGAFFVAVLQKLKPLSENELKQIGSNAEGSTSPSVENKKIDSGSCRNPRKKRRFNGFREDPFVFFEENESVWPDIKSFYNIDDDFDPKCLLTRCLVGKKKNIYCTSSAVRDLVVINKENVKFVNTGVKTFVRSDNRNMKCAFRLAQEGLESLFPHIGDERKIIIPKDDLTVLLMNTDPQNPPLIENLSENIQKQVENLSAGSCLLIYKDEDGLILHISGWRGTKSLKCYTTLTSTVHLLRLIGGDISKYEVNKFKKLDEEGDDEEQEKEATTTANEAQ